MQRTNGMALETEPEKGGGGGGKGMELVGQRGRGIDEDMPLGALNKTHTTYKCTSSVINTLVFDN